MQHIPQDFIAFDIETTGLAPKTSKIIEIGAVKVVQGEIIGFFERFVNPGCPIPYNITVLTGITDEMVFDADDIDTVLPEFLCFVGELPFAAHNIRFDMSFIKLDAERLRLSIRNQEFDTVPLSRKLFAQLPNHKLGTVARHLKAEQEKAHRGLDDARVVAEILLYAQRQRSFLV
jgi:DNA polymerase-3 subunit alpha (Gram-positive type)